MTKVVTFQQHIEGEVPLWNRHYEHLKDTTDTVGINELYDYAIAMNMDSFKTQLAQGTFVIDTLKEISKSVNQFYPGIGDSILVSNDYRTPGWLRRVLLCVAWYHQLSLPFNYAIQYGTKCPSQIKEIVGNREIRCVDVSALFRGRDCWLQKRNTYRPNDPGCVYACPNVVDLMERYLWPKDESITITTTSVLHPLSATISSTNTSTKRRSTEGGTLVVRYDTKLKYGRMTSPDIIIEDMLRDIVRKWDLRGLTTMLIHGIFEYNTYKTIVDAVNTYCNGVTTEMLHSGKGLDQLMLCLAWKLGLYTRRRYYDNIEGLVLGKVASTNMDEVLCIAIRESAVTCVCVRCINGIRDDCVCKNEITMRCNDQGTHPRHAIVRFKSELFGEWLQRTRSFVETYSKLGCVFYAKDEEVVIKWS